MFLRSMTKKGSKKGGKKGKGKGKKESKLDFKLDKEWDPEKVKANAALWEARLEVIENSRGEYQEIARKLGRVNEELTNQQYRAEKNTTDILACLNQKELQKEAKVAALEEQLKDEKSKAFREKQALVAEYKMKINALEDKLMKRTSELCMIQEKLKTVKEFSKKKAHMEQELNTIKENMYIADREHQETLARMEHKYFCEKVRLEKEAEQRIAQLAVQAHNEAIVQLDDASRSVFKENVRLNEALRYHLKEVEKLRRSNEALTEQNNTLALNKETSELMMKENISQLAAQRRKISELKDKGASLEQTLVTMATEFEQEKTAVQEHAILSTNAGSKKLEKLQELLSKREHELRRVKRLAHSIVEQRTELEIFFHEALSQVKQEIITSQMKYRQEVMEVYRKQMSEARSGRRQYPHIRTFNKASHSANNVFTDLEEAERLSNLQSLKVDISELTWEQKERVLRLLFAKMNGIKLRRSVQFPALSASSEKSQNRRDSGATKEESNTTFITQAVISKMTSNASRIPDQQSI